MNLPERPLQPPHVPGCGPFLREAREDLIERILDGDKVCGRDLECVLEQWFDQNADGASRDLYELLSGIGYLGDERSQARCKAIHDRLLQLVTAYVNADEDLIREHAEELMLDYEQEHA